MLERQDEQGDLTPAERELEAAMRVLRPAPAALDRDRVLFEAGAAAGRARAGRSLLAWRAAAALVAVALGASWLWRGGARPGPAPVQERIVYVEKAGSGAAEFPGDASDDDDPPAQQFAASATRADPFSQSFSRPDDGYLALRGAVTFRGVNAVRDVRAKFVASKAPAARPAATSLPG
jgi:hypothetical protein